jgi:outer membrane receptor protein involved in Fe transport
MPLFVSNFNFAAGYNKFNVLYDDGDARVSGFTGELDYKTSDDVNVFGRVEFIDYKMATAAQAWNLPKFKLSAGTAIHINDKVTINGSLIIRGDAKDPMLTAGRPTTIPTFTDLNGGVQYKINKRFAVFGQVNNILSTANQTWLYYSNYGFNIFGGASYSF